MNTLRTVRRTPLVAKCTIAGVALVGVCWLVIALVGEGDDGGDGVAPPLAEKEAGPSDVPALAASESARSARQTIESGGGSAQPETSASGSTPRQDEGEACLVEVVDDRGVPVPGAQIELAHDFAMHRFPISGETDSAGLFECKYTLDEGSICFVAVRASDYAWFHKRIAFEELGASQRDHFRAVVTLSAGARVQVSVFDHDATPVASHWVRGEYRGRYVGGKFSGDSGDSVEERYELTDEHGIATFSGLAHGL